MGGSASGKRGVKRWMSTSCVAATVPSGRLFERFDPASAAAEIFPPIFHGKGVEAVVKWCGEPVSLPSVWSAMIMWANIGALLESFEHPLSGPCLIL